MSKPKATYLPALDGLRAVAVGCIIAFHLGRFPGGFLSLDVFFVISGFLITRLLLREWEGTGGIAMKAFWGRRFRRLVPALLMVIAAVELMSRLWLPAWRLGDIRNDGLAAIGYVANWRFVASGQSYFAHGIGPSPLRHMWSLAIEEQFYLVWPVVVLAAVTLAAKRRFDARRVVGTVALVGALVSAVWMVVQAGKGGPELTRVYYGTQTRAFSIFGGAWLASWWDPAIARAKGRAGHAGRRERDRRWATAGTLGLAGVCLLMVSAREDHLATYRGILQLTSVLAVVGVAGLATGEGALARGLASPVPQWFGRRSYGIYLWSWPTQVFLVAHFGVGGWSLDLAVVAITVGLATLSYRLVEAPILARRQVRVEPVDGPRPEPVAPAGFAAGMLAGRRTVGFSALAVLAVVTLTIGVAAGAPAKPSVFSVTDKQAAEVALRRGSSFSPTSGSGPSTTTTAVVPDVGSSAQRPAVGAGSPIPPGPFDPSSKLLVPGPAADPEAVFGRPLRIMVAGDSIGWSLAWATVRPDMTPAVQVSNRAILACGVMPIGTIRVPVSDQPEPYPPTCASAPEARSLGLAEHPDVVLLSLGAWEVFDQRVDGKDYRVGTEAYAQLLEKQIDGLVDEFRAAGVPTVVPLVPCFGASPVYPVERLDHRRIRWVNARIRAVARQNRGWVRLIDPTDQLCDADGTATARTPTGIEIRPDGAHFETDSAVWFWNTWLAGEVAGAFPNRG